MNTAPRSPAIRTSLRVFVDTPRWFIRPHNTDWRYMNSLKRLEEQIPVHMIYGSGAVDAARDSLRYIYGFIRRPHPRGAADYARCGAAVAAASTGADLVLSHRRFPLDVPRPVVWQYAVLDPQMQAATGIPVQDVEAQYTDQEPFYGRAARVQVSSLIEAERHAARFPHLGEKFMPCPFFLPHITPIAEERVRAKHADDQRIAICFVGREARRKGLDVALEAIAALHAAERRRIDLFVVSPERPTAPDEVRLHHQPSARPPEVQAMMAASHLYVMPSRFESFGFTLIEAMAQGCAVIGPNGEVQREMLDQGAAGCPTGPDVGAVTAALQRLMSGPAERLRMARAALARYHERYSARVVAGQYLNLFQRAVS